MFVNGQCFITQLNLHQECLPARSSCTYCVYSFLYFFVCFKTISEREAEIMKLQEQLIEVKRAHEASQAALASQSSQSIQANDSTAAGDFSQTQHDELTKLKQEVLALNIMQSILDWFLLHFYEDVSKNNSCINV